MNPQNKKQVIIASALGVALVAIVLYQFVIKGVSPPKLNTPKPAQASSVPSPVAPSHVQLSADANLTRLKADDVDLDKLIEDIEVVTFDYQSSRIDRDPMAPLIGFIRTGDAKPILETPLVADVLRKKVTGIIWDQYEPVAVVDNELVSPGHTYSNGVQVFAIEHDRVIFKVGDSLYPVAMKEL